ncbi:hypothetical protein ABZP36_010676 [Zizania latifolia]
MAVHAASPCYGFQDQGTMIVAASDGLWDGGRACGRMYTVRCIGGTNAVPNPGGTVTVKIVDRCPSPGCTSTLDLSREAFAAIGNLDAGRIIINYNPYAFIYIHELDHFSYFTFSLAHSLIHRFTLRVIVLQGLN